MVTMKGEYVAQCRHKMQLSMSLCSTALLNNPDIWHLKLKTGVPDTPALGNVHTHLISIRCCGTQLLSDYYDSGFWATDEAAIRHHHIVLTQSFMLVSMIHLFAALLLREQDTFKSPTPKTSC